MENNTGEMAVNSGKKPEKMTLAQVGLLIKLARKAKGYATQGDLAQAAGLDKDLINAMENGRRKAGLESYNKVAEVLGISFEITIPVDEGRQ